MDAWEVFMDCDGMLAIADGPETVACRWVRNEALARQIAALPRLMAFLVAVSGDLDTSVSEGSTVKDLSEETQTELLALLTELGVSAA